MNLPVDAKYLSAALADGCKANQLTLVHKKLGDLRLPTGQLVACDPFVLPRSKPFSLAFSEGSFPLVLSIAHIGTDQRTAFATVRFKPSEPLNWVMMSVEGENLRELKDGHIFGYPVDSGTGCFMDFTASEALDRRMKDQPNYFETMIAEMEKTYVHTWSWLNLSLDNANLIAFSSGDGDGVYATYAGYDAQDEVSAVVTDFAVFEV